MREITKKYSILMITDEVMAGFGRTGFWFALDDYDYTPDITRPSPRAATPVTVAARA